LITHVEDVLHEVLDVSSFAFELSVDVLSWSRRRRDDVQKSRDSQSRLVSCISAVGDYCTT